MNEMDFENRIVSTEFSEADTDIENSLRPKELTDYIGQEKAKGNLSIFIQAAKMRGEPLD
ncbi:MAG: Holliday junction branch migration DNA helicase RuvB, partial [Eubacterium sp.]|nr:Holliday junction branch migration DNA helicase RuvB [Eubacterium sp.]